MIIGNCLILKDFSSEPFFGAVEIENGTIKRVIQGEVEVDLDLSGKLVMPALFNTHTHAPMTLLRGVAEDLSFEEWLFSKVLPIEDRLTEKMTYYGTILAQMEMARHGIAGFVDMYFHEEWIAKAVRDFGMRALLTRGLVDSNGDDGGRLEENLKLYNDWNGFEGRIFVGFGPHSPYLCSEKYLKRVFDTAKSLNAPVTIHLYETSKEEYDLEDILNIGLKEVKTIAAHCVHLPERYFGVLKDVPFFVSHNPASNLKLGNGIAPVQRMIEHGMKVTLGTDGAASNNSLNLFFEMRLASLLQKAQNPRNLDVNTCLKMVTYDGAQAMGFKSGKIEEGWNADLVVIDLDLPEMFPVQNIKNHLVHAFSGEVFATMVAGKWIYFDGEYLTIDSEEVKRELARIEKELYSS
ncbi:MULTISPECIES: 5-methylthioadenosine/S-adenosylhomocysteine deaminase [unclassified Thermotoga]|uniref:5-methylthioadenosine/S-adenosylhomocysteine deaminase n=1 Tax=unclassified Thermotoga TaxID=2631113 RepID=UPI000280EACF|nr:MULTISPECIES: 5-methylthioadenosine/S-adenosylhomocysteine deaminase [unclassified Thermotoga]AIY87367.1 amidohydrolase [Thermotoga sp. 2812B]EJX26646.1 amidohydrolase [Thermotoga sp. EMP]